MDSDISDILECNYSPRLYQYYSLISKEITSLLEYTKDFTTVLVDENSIKESARLLKEESSAFLYELFENGKSISHLSMCFDYDKLQFNHSNLIRTSLLQTSPSDIVFNCKNIPFEVNKNSDVVNIIHTYLNQNYDINISLASKEHLNSIIDL